MQFCCSVHFSFAEVHLPQSIELWLTIEKFSQMPSVANLSDDKEVMSLSPVTAITARGSKVAHAHHADDNDTSR